MSSTVPILARAAIGSLPIVSGRRSAELPDRTLTRDGVTLDRERLAAYDRVCGFGFRDTLPGTYPHVLAFPLHLQLLAARAFPLPAIGLVHIANAIVQHRPVDAGEPLALSVRAADLRPHCRGRQFDFVTEVRAGNGELVWEERSTNLRIEHRDEHPADRPSDPVDPVEPDEPLREVASWRLGSDLGRRYAAVSGDHNPIHLHPLTARLFGFRAAIAHGMWTAARCLAALEPRLPPAYAVEVAFKRPIVLPATVTFAERAGPGLTSFAVHDARDQTPHLAGTLTASV